MVGTNGWTIVAYVQPFSTVSTCHSLLFSSFLTSPNRTLVWELPIVIFLFIGIFYRGACNEPINVVMFPTKHLDMGVLRQVLREGLDKTVGGIVQ